jgi:hypothetical protein
MNSQRLNLATDQLARSLELPREVTREKLDRLLKQHKTEWEDFMASLRPNSFVVKWACEVPS